mmetsp:Transcript_51558/g.120955  ORF Transcript_51558/g.120955 Transcript_51558/m.120955 type:complete len:515 (+) Transcript_51558:226-1770(+)
MVVLSACLTSKAGKPLVARQFVEISRIRIEGLLAAFPKLIGAVKQHTYVETESVRYVFQPMENLYLLLVTNKSSNIMEDLETLRLLARLVPEFAPHLEEEYVREQAFEIMLAFDEVLAMGHRETINLTQVKTALEMESHEEKLHNMIRQSKINEAKEEAKKKATAIDQTKAQRQKAGLGGMGSGMGSAMQGAFQDEGERKPVRVFDSEGQPEAAPAPARKAPPKGKGMQLGSKTKQTDVMKALEAEDELMGMAPVAAAPAAKGGAAEARKVSVSNEAVVLKVEEKVCVRLNKDGGVESLEVKGELKMMINDPEASYVKVQVQHGKNAAFQFKTHPNINRGMWADDAVLCHRDQTKNFPVGTELGVLKWRLPPSTNSALLPIGISCWPSVSGNNATVNLEYESASSLDLANLRVIVPCPAQATVADVSEGDARYLAKSGTVEWRVELVDDANRSGNMEFSADDVDADAFFPISVSFTATGTLCGIQVSTVSDTRNDSPLQFAASTMLEVEEYEIQ